MDDDVAKITESRPIYGDGKVVGWEQWIYFQKSGGPKVGHMIGTSSHTGDFNHDYDALIELMREHEATCAACRQWLDES